MKNRNYEAIKVRVVVNGKEEALSCELAVILLKYSQLCKGELGNGARIEDLTQEILDFIEKLEHETNGLIYDTQGEIISERMIAVLADRHYREKRR